MSLGFHIVSRDSGIARLLPMLLRLESVRQGYLAKKRIPLHRVKRAAAGVLIYAFDRLEMDAPGFAEEQIKAVEADSAPLKIFLHLAAWEVHGPVQVEIDAKNRTIETMARRCSALVLRTAEVMRSGTVQRIRKSGRPNLYGYLAIAHSAVRLIRFQMLQAGAQRQFANASGAPAEPGIETMPSAPEVLEAIEWSGAALPAVLGDSFTLGEVLDFADGQVSFASWEIWGRFPLGDPIDWAMEGANLSWQSYFNGLTFLQPVLAYWFGSPGTSKSSKAITHALRNRGIAPDALLSRAAFVIADFVRRNPSTGPANRRAFSEGTITHRVKTVLMFLICCRKAKDAGIAIDNDAFALACRSLGESLQVLRSAEIYPEAGNHGVRQDSILVLAGLLLHKLQFGRNLLQLGLDRIANLQIKPGLSSDGVWLENSFGYHLLIMNLFTKIATDLGVAGEPGAEILRGALERMWPFAEAFIKPDGTGPLIGDTAPRRLFPIMAAARQLLDGAGEGAAPDISPSSFVRAKNTYYFPDAGYFASHTRRELLDAPSSTMLFYSNLVNAKHKHSDDLSVLLSHRASDLLIDGGTYNKEISDRVRNAARYDPASHNTFRVNNAGYRLRARAAKKRAGLDGMWEGPGWSAARGYNHAYADADVTRVAIHLKEHHAVIVFDRFSSKGAREALFEQFWHISPHFRPQDTGRCDGGAIFSSKAHGHLLAAFDSNGADCEIIRGGKGNPLAWAMLLNGKTVPTPYVRRSQTTRAGAMASLFQWSEVASTAEIALLEARDGTIEMRARGNGFAARFVIGENGVTCAELDAVARR
ncbi:MAG TPA: heparinase II/III family protein [Rhizomicrobium sp.]